MDETNREEARACSWLRRFFCLLAILSALTLLVAAPISGLWLYLSGDPGVDRAVAAQKNGFALFGSGLSRGPADDLVYKLALYAEKKPQVVLAGSASMLSLRSNVFVRPMLNMAGTASSLSTLRASLDAMLAVHRPEVVLLALDFWWFSPAWEADPFARPPREPDNVYAYTPNALRMPWQSLFEGRLTLPQFLFLSFQEGRFGLRAHFASDGFGPDGSWYAGSTLTSTRAADAHFLRTMDRLHRRLGEFGGQNALSQAHLDALADIYFRLRGRGIVPVVFLAPLAGPVHDALKEAEAEYPHLFRLREALRDRGIALTDTSDPRYFGSGPCEFLDGTHAGEVAAIRVLRELTSSWNGLLGYVDMEQINRAITEWKDHAALRTDNLPNLWEGDFLNLGCLKKTR